MKNLQEIAIAILQNKDYFDVNLSSQDILLLSKFLVKNKISLLELCKRNNAAWIIELFCYDSFKNAVTTEKILLESWELEFLQIKERWDKENIQYTFHKSIGSFPHLSDNLDVLVKSKNYLKASELLESLKYVDARNIQEDHKKFFRKYYGKHIMVPIHLHERVCWCVPYENIEHLWENRQQSDEDKLVFYPGYEDCILVNTAHCFMEDHIIKLKDLLYIKKSIDSKNIDWNYIIQTSRELHWELSLHTAFVIFQHLYNKLFSEDLFPKEIINTSTSFIKRIPWVYNTVLKLFEKEVIMPFKIPHLWVRRHTALRELNDPSFGNKFARWYQVIGGLADRFIHLKLKWHNQPGILIAFSGLDGSGKTRHIDSLENAFNNSEIKTKRIWTRVGSLRITNFLSRLYKSKYKKKRKIEENYSIDTNKISKIDNQFIVYIWKLLNVFELILYYSVYIRFLKLSNKVVLCDRYFIDTLVDLEAYGKNPRFDRFVYKMYKMLIPKPELTFLIKAPVELIKKRSGNKIEEDIEYNNSLMEMAANGKVFIEIDNSQDFEEVSMDLIHTTLETYFKKYPSKYYNYKVVSFRYK